MLFNPKSERFEHLESRINPADEEMIALIRDLVGRNVDLGSLR